MNKGEGEGESASSWSTEEGRAVRATGTIPWPPPVTAAMSSHFEDPLTTLHDPGHLHVGSSSLGNCVLQ